MEDARQAHLDHPRLQRDSQLLSLIVESSDDGIISKDLNGIIQSWNRGAERIFGYSAAEIVGRPITTVIPNHLHHEEPEILSRIMRGERIDHYETIRQRKDGTLIDVAVTISPLRDNSGTIIGASKIARDITESKKAQERQALLLREMSHRIKNLFAVASGVVALSARSAETAKELAQTVQSRLGALSRAHDLTLLPTGESAGLNAKLGDLARAILTPYDSGDGRIESFGPEVDCGPSASTSFALLLHEFATNSIKYGALSDQNGKVAVSWAASDVLTLHWIETGVAKLHSPEQSEGFGEVLVETTIKSLGGTVARNWNQDGLAIEIVVPVANLAQ